MLNTSHQITPEINLKQTLVQNTSNPSQYGPLLRFPDSLPVEGIARITCFLDPHSLLSLDRVNRFLHAHITDDITWQRAFLCRFLSIQPEAHFNETTSLMLRRFHPTWRKEYISRYNLLRRWELSRNSTIQHTPLHSAISGMHMMPSATLLTSSIAHGVVARSVPLTGKIFRGYLDAAGTGGGLGVGNPNVEFSPNVTSCSLNSDGGTAKVAWGLRSGEICVLTAGKAMDANQRTAASVVRSKVDQDHTGNVHDVIWGDPKGNTVVSGSADGLIKIWDAKKVRCLWTSTRQPGVVVPDPCLRLAAAINQGFVVGVLSSGQIALSYNFSPYKPDEGVLDTKSVRSVWLASPATQVNGADTPIVLELVVDQFQDRPTFLVSYKEHPYFYRVTIQDNNSAPIISVFGDSNSGADTTSLVAHFSKAEGERSFVVTGDSLGYINVYAWDNGSSPIRRVDASFIGSTVSSLAWNGSVLVAGSSSGALHVFDGLTLEQVRNLPYFVARRARNNGQHNSAIRQILLGPNQDVVFASAGDKVIAFKAGPVPTYRGGGVRGRQSGPPRKKQKNRVGNQSKYQERLELNESISEERGLIDQEQSFTRRTFGQEKEQVDTLATLGLSETEAVEYALMLSRDEALDRVGATQDDEGFLGEFDDIPMLSSPETPTKVLGSSSPKVIPSGSNDKIQISPRYKAEAMEAGFPTESFSPSSVDSTPNRNSEADFPSFSSSFSPPKSKSPSSSGGGSKSAWSSTLKKDSGSSPPMAGPSSRSVAVSKTKSEDVIDEELRLAIELSLAEADAEAKRTRRAVT